MRGFSKKLGVARRLAPGDLEERKGSCIVEAALRRRWKKRITRLAHVHYWWSSAGHSAGAGGCYGGAWLEIAATGCMARVYFDLLDLGDNADLGVWRTRVRLRGHASLET